MSVVIVDYGSGNLRSAANAFERVAGTGAVTVTSDAETVARAERVVLPGVGAFADCRAGLAAVPGMTEALDEAVLRRGRPFLGICVGMQLMAERGLEHGEHRGLGWIPGDVVAIEPGDSRLKVPHIGWNEIGASEPRHPVLDGLADGSHLYFVHSYHLRCADPAHRLAEVDYDGPLAAVVGRDNMVGTQFHPEKSQRNGLRLIANFMAWRP